MRPIVSIRSGVPKGVMLEASRCRYGPRAAMCGATRDVRFGPLADICSAKGHVRFTPKRTCALQLAMSAMGQ